MRDLNQTTTMGVYKCDLEWLRENIAAQNDNDRLWKLIDFWQRNYNVSNADWAATEIRKQIKAILKEEDNGRK